MCYNFWGNFGDQDEPKRPIKSLKVPKTSNCKYPGCVVGLLNTKCAINKSTVRGWPWSTANSSSRGKTLEHKGQETGDRTLLVSDGAVALCPNAQERGHEIWVMPHSEDGSSHRCSFADATAEELTKERGPLAEGLLDAR